MIKVVEDSDLFFDVYVEAIINPVNTIGVPGAGLAKEFSKRFPKYTNDYKHSCKTEIILPGSCRLHIIDPIERTPNHILKYIFSFYTKDHWKDKSQLDYIIVGLENLYIYMLKKDIKSIAIPALGCGLGGLIWSDVFELIQRRLTELKSDIYVFPPRRR